MNDEMSDVLVQRIAHEVESCSEVKSSIVSSLRFRTLLSRHGIDQSIKTHFSLTPLLRISIHSILLFPLLFVLILISPGPMPLPEVCCICSTKFNTGEEPERPVHLPCNLDHIFGETCITKWLQERKGRAGCPLCRVDPLGAVESSSTKVLIRVTKSSA